MQAVVFKIISELSPVKIAITEDLDLKKDLRFDSILLVELAVKMNEELNVDLGEKTDQGQELKTVKDILKCLA